MRQLLTPVLALGPSRQFIQQRHFWSAQDYLLEPPEPIGRASKSLVTSRWPDPPTVMVIVEWVRNWQPGVAGNSGYVTLFALGAQSDRPRPDETAVAHRDAVFVIDIGTVWKETTPAEMVPQLLKQIGAMHDTLRRDLGNSAAYVNFPDPDLPDWPSAYYGANYPRLVQIKHRYDPANLFHYQSIGSA